MLLYTHAINDERLRAGLLPVNSFWASGTGALAESALPAQPPALQMPTALRDAALLQDWSGWTASWQQLDNDKCRSLNDCLDRGEAATLTLCGEANARTWSGRDAGVWRRMRGLFRRDSLPILFGSL